MQIFHLSLMNYVTAIIITPKHFFYTFSYFESLFVSLRFPHLLIPSHCCTSNNLFLLTCAFDTNQKFSRRLKQSCTLLKSSLLICCLVRDTTKDDSKQFLPSFYFFLVFQLAVMCLSKLLCHQQTNPPPRMFFK